MAVCAKDRATGKICVSLHMTVSKRGHTSGTITCRFVDATLLNFNIHIVNCRPVEEILTVIY